MKKQIEIPEYVLSGNKNIPKDLKVVQDYFENCGNKNYQVCLVGDKEKLSKDLKKKNYQGKEFIHLDDKNLKDIYSFLPDSIKNSIKKINRMISNSENSFNQNHGNKSILGIHTLGLVPIDEIKNLNELNYGNCFWHDIKVYERSPGT